MLSFSVGELGGLALVAIEPEKMKYLVVQMAANIIFQVQNMPVDDTSIPTEGTSGIVAGGYNVKWDAYEFALAFQLQVRLVYQCLPTLLNYVLLNKEEARLVMEALEVYQSYATKRAGGPSQTDWSDRNEQLAGYIKMLSS